MLTAKRGEIFEAGLSLLSFPQQISGYHKYKSKAIEILSIELLFGWRNFLLA